MTSGDWATASGKITLEVTEADKAKFRAEMPILPLSLIERFKIFKPIRDAQDDADLDASMKVTIRKTLRKITLRDGYGLSSDAAEAMAISLDTSEFFIETVEDGADSVQAANWILGIIFAKLNEHNMDISASPVTPILLASLLKRIADKTISNNAAKLIFERLWTNPDLRIKSVSALGGVDWALEVVDEIIVKDGLKQESDSGAIEAIIDEVLAANLAMVEEFKAGKEKAFNALVGQCMKASKGKANPAQVSEILKKKLSS